MPAPRRTRPHGQITRGKTARNRLRKADAFLILYDPALLKRREGDFAHALYVDLGYGAEPFTTLESAARLRTLHPALPVLGVEIDPERVAAAQPYADALTHFRLGGFNLPLEKGETVRVIRAFNVLRQYEEHEVGPAWDSLGASLLPGGLLLEGTSDPFGRLWVANLLRKGDTGLGLEAVVFGTNFRWGFEPALFQPVLPKNFIHRMTPGEPVYEFFEDWKAAARAVIGVKDLGLRQWFIASAEQLAQRGQRVDVRRKLLSRGLLVWRPER
ncbi:MAG: methylase [Anaerolineae bacterium]|nr:MAG: methylase [Anaerolineae bacterium]